jgi:uncharacterized protein
MSKKTCYCICLMLNRIQLFKNHKMLKEVQLVLSPKDAALPEIFLFQAAQKAGISIKDIRYWQEVRRSIDARQRNVKINLTLQLAIGETENPFDKSIQIPDYKNVQSAEPVLVVGSGPAGLFAALRLIELGLKPVVLERGKDVSERRRDIATMNREHRVKPNSNYCFGEGGAGAFSDGKLYTRSNKRGNIRKILEVFHLNGADKAILSDAHPHIGTDKLPNVIESIREKIIHFGGEVHFNSPVTEIILADGKVKGVKLAGGETYTAKAIILATGHSARDVYQFLHKSDILLEAKPFAMGVRAEHPQDLIDSIQYHTHQRDPYLPAASYNLVKQVDGRGVYSFCMCPGGHIVPAMTAPGQIVVNGMSASKRNSPWANAGLVVEVKPEDLVHYAKYGSLAGLYYQQDLEERAFMAVKQGITAPAQRIADFVDGKLSNNLPSSSYLPGLQTSPMHEWLPKAIAKRLKEGFLLFEGSMRGYLTNEAIIVGVESRTSTPVKIPRSPETLEHVQVSGLYPCGEGAGYAGGIVSSAMDGENCAEKVAAKILAKS